MNELAKKIFEFSENPNPFLKFCVLYYVTNKRSGSVLLNYFHGSPSKNFNLVILISIQMISLKKNSTSQKTVKAIRKADPHIGIQEQESKSHQKKSLLETDV